MESRLERHSPRDISLNDGVPGSEYVYLFLLFPGISVFLGIGLYQVSIVLFLAAIGLVVVLSDDLRVSRSLLLVTLLFGAFLLYAAISLWWSPSSEYAQFKLIRLAVVCSLLLVAPALTFPEGDRVYTFFKLSLYMSLLVAALLIFAYFSPKYRYPHELYGSASHIRAGRAVGFGIVVATHYILMARRSGRRYTYGFILSILLFAIVISGSRGPLLAAIGASGILVLLDLTVRQGKPHRAYQFLLVSAVGVASLLVMSIVLGVSIPTLGEIIPIIQGDIDPSAASRLETYYQGIVYWLQAPLLGNGLGSFGPMYSGKDTMYYPHNFAIEILAELGLIGLVLFGALLCVSFRSLVVNLRTHPIAILLFSLLVFALVNASLSKDLQGNRILFGIIGLTLTLELFSVTDR